MPKELNMHLYNPELQTLPRNRKARRALAKWKKRQPNLVGAANTTPIVIGHVSNALAKWKKHQSDCDALLDASTLEKTVDRIGGEMGLDMQALRDKGRALVGGIDWGATDGDTSAYGGSRKSSAQHTGDIYRLQQRLGGTVCGRCSSTFTTARKTIVSYRSCPISRRYNSVS